MSNLPIDIDVVVQIIYSKVPSISTLEYLIKERIDEVCQCIKTYCNRDDIPACLKYVVANMSIDLLKSEALNGQLDDPALSAVSIGSILSIKDGDSETKFKSPKTAGGTGSHVADVDSVLFNYKALLNKYRIARW